MSDHVFEEEQKQNRTPPIFMCGGGRRPAGKREGIWTAAATGIIVSMVVSVTDFTVHTTAEDAPLAFLQHSKKRSIAYLINHSLSKLHQLGKKGQKIQILPSFQLDVHFANDLLRFPNYHFDRL